MGGDSEATQSHTLCGTLSSLEGEGGFQGNAKPHPFGQTFFTPQWHAKSRWTAKAHRALSRLPEDAPPYASPNLSAMACKVSSARQQTYRTRALKAARLKATLRCFKSRRSSAASLRRRQDQNFSTGLSPAATGEESPQAVLMHACEQCDWLAHARRTR